MVHRRSIRIFSAIFLAGLLTIFAAVFSLNQGAASGAAHTDSGPAIPSNLLSGSFIEMHLLQVSGLPTGPDGIWTVVEWQEPLTKQWHTVEGWQGTVELDGRQQWWVAPADYGTGPFRWLAFEERGVEWLGLSDNFDLPASSNEVVVVQMKPLGQD